MSFLLCFQSRNYVKRVHLRECASVRPLSYVFMSSTRARGGSSDYPRRLGFLRYLESREAACTPSPFWHGWGTPGAWNSLETRCWGFQVRQAAGSQPPSKPWQRSWDMTLWSGIPRPQPPGLNTSTRRACQSPYLSFSYSSTCLCHPRMACAATAPPPRLGLC